MKSNKIVLGTKGVHEMEKPSITHIHFDINLGRFEVVLEKNQVARSVYVSFHNAIESGFINPDALVFLTDKM
jgi:hypothetical protein